MRFLKAADGNRTRDLRTTNATLYRLSHSSIFVTAFAITVLYSIKCPSVCQQNNCGTLRQVFID